ncbi:MAG: hypothetical protein BRD40_01080 [Bacteroidetes bacterium QS_1_65_9]|nr:MAG: hypothetical protein BRD40_01080 [Bacteroidetes bacterium QS_1_65_9]
MEGHTAPELSPRLGIALAERYWLISFPASAIEGSLASPIRRPDVCFAGSGRTRGGARSLSSRISRSPNPPKSTRWRDGYRPYRLQRRNRCKRRTHRDYANRRGASRNGRRPTQRQGMEAN